ncbi:undecaprenyldiphospho-muramoylpentapeptide beta-N-acetylglucosaminyltransferase [Marinigracilibium pacificum]|uniref:UDP-N-acetylglucosamine--N-acetylmuramyl-(pentapeptide) pyrophosphoryl-undecaprenol N-acetylglucosamine transferase n=1 Tax=Marinigracilibium pacificum TaxID=2729599 RepID=A0A848IZW2_9BACT|nr:undecaprenyldiphospho-muramoylpentapeptide beta-N-acetylglucosaminyltransferase [Marinigracilibium pacificum]NMM50083.1 undecaprenyldiphospho-muramoylpentapeptide beta-N-acetylglucosaminyltransferase [Marinigracilibium pacificum]
MSDKKPYRIIVSGGGTGGHIYPAIAIAQEFQRRHKDAKILFVGAKGKMEMQKVPEAGFDIKGLWISGLQRKATVRNLLFPVKLMKSLVDARRIVKAFKPDVAVGVGGYAAGPLLYVAAKRKVPTLIQEQNSFAGLTNKWLAKSVQVICVAYKNMGRFFPPYKIKLTGNPVRAEIAENLPSREEAAKHFGFDSSKPVLLIIGGSLGARSINEGVLLNLRKWTNEGIQVLWQCGKFYEEEMERRVAKITGLNMSMVKVTAFIKEMNMAYSLSDLVVSRAGALSVSELCLVGKPVIFIPSPHVAEDHQTKNAQALEENGAAICLKDSEQTEKLGALVSGTIKDEEKKKTLGEAIKKMALPNATKDIVDEIEKLIK